MSLDLGSLSRLASMSELLKKHAAGNQNLTLAQQNGNQADSSKQGSSKNPTNMTNQGNTSKMGRSVDSGEGGSATSSNDGSSSSNPHRPRSNTLSSDPDHHLRDSTNTASSKSSEGTLDVENDTEGDRQRRELAAAMAALDESDDTIPENALAQGPTTVHNNDTQAQVLAQVVNSSNLVRHPTPKPVIVQPVTSQHNNLNQANLPSLNTANLPNINTANNLSSASNNLNNLPLQQAIFALTQLQQRAKQQAQSKASPNPNQMMTGPPNPLLNGLDLSSLHNSHQNQLATSPNHPGHMHHQQMQHQPSPNNLLPTFANLSSLSLPMDTNQSSTAQYSDKTQNQIRKRKRDPNTPGEKEFKTCLICGDRATGLHYGIISCEGCKGFFKRSICNRRVYRCSRNGNCEMSRKQRNRCQYCRLKKCLEVGMNRKAIREDGMPGGRNKNIGPVTLTLEEIDSVLSGREFEMDLKIDAMQGLGQPTLLDQSYGNGDNKFPISLVQQSNMQQQNPTANLVLRNGNSLYFANQVKVENPMQNSANSLAQVVAQQNQNRVPITLNNNQAQGVQILQQHQLQQSQQQNGISPALAAAAALIQKAGQSRGSSTSPTDSSGSGRGGGSNGLAGTNMMPGHNGLAAALATHNAVGVSNLQQNHNGNSSIMHRGAHALLTAAQQISQSGNPKAENMETDEVTVDDQENQNSNNMPINPDRMFPDAAQLIDNLMTIEKFDNLDTIKEIRFDSQKKVSKGDLLMLLARCADEMLVRQTNWIKKLPFYDKLSVKDHVTLLTTTWPELNLLAAFTVHKQDVLFGLLASITSQYVPQNTDLHQFSESEMELLERLLSLYQRLEKLNIDEQEYVVMKVINFLNQDVKNLANPNNVEEINKAYWYKTQAWIEMRFKIQNNLLSNQSSSEKQPQRFRELMLCLPEIRVIAGRLHELDLEKIPLLLKAILQTIQMTAKDKVQQQQMVSMNGSTSNGNSSQDSKRRRTDGLATSSEQMSHSLSTLQAQMNQVPMQSIIKKESEPTTSPVAVNLLSRSPPQITSNSKQTTSQVTPDKSHASAAVDPKKLQKLANLVAAAQNLKAE